MIRVDKNVINIILNKLGIEFLYLIFTIIYLYFLNKYNNLLLSKFDSNDYINILFYNNYETIIYFTIAIILFLIGTILIVYRWRTIRNQDLEFEDVIWHFIAMFILLILIILILIFINNPILRAVFIGVFILYASCES